MPSCAAQRNSAVTALRMPFPRQVLMNDLPHKTEFVLVIKTTPLQRRLYKAFIERRRKEVGRAAAVPPEAHAHADHSA